MFARARCSFVLLAVSLFSAGAAARDVITGFCYTERIERPVAGALVALYGPDNILSGSTYSTNTGAFTPEDVKNFETPVGIVY
jgi:hypothetical protein